MTTEDADRLRVASDLLQEHGMVVDERHLAALLGVEPTPGALAATCGTCGKDVTAEGQWLRCREHYVKELELVYALADRIAELALRFQQAVETLESCSAHASLPGYDRAHEQVVLDAANTREDIESDLTEALETYHQLRRTP
jgi:hypothetical protein